VAERDAAIVCLKLARGRLEATAGTRARYQAFAICWPEDLPLLYRKNVNSFEARPQQILPWEQLTANAALRVWEMTLVAALSVRPDTVPKPGLAYLRGTCAFFY